MCSITDLFTNCKNYIELLKTVEKGCFLTHCSTDNNIDIIARNYYIKKRTPKNMPLAVHKKLNKYYENIFGWPIRNGLFSFGMKANIDKYADIGYGKSYLLFPCHIFKYVYEPDIFDLYCNYHAFMKENKNADVISFINTLHYTDKGIESEMANINYEGRSVEIIINCKKYYLVNTKYYNELTERIWS